MFASRRPDSNRRVLSERDYKSRAFNLSATSARLPYSGRALAESLNTQVKAKDSPSHRGGMGGRDPG